MYLSNLGVALRTLARETQDTDLLAEAVETDRAAAAALPAYHPERAGQLSNLGFSLHLLSERTGNTELLTEAAETTHVLQSDNERPLG